MLWAGMVLGYRSRNYDVTDAASHLMPLARMVDFEADVDFFIVEILGDRGFRDVFYLEGLDQLRR